MAYCQENRTRIEEDHKDPFGNVHFSEREQYPVRDVFYSFFFLKLTPRKTRALQNMIGKNVILVLLGTCFYYYFYTFITIFFQKNYRTCFLWWHGVQQGV